MKDSSDTKTLDLLPAPKKRGRPATGNAKSAAQRMRDVRNRDIRRMGEGANSYSSMTLTGLYDWLRYAVKNRNGCVFESVVSELRLRISRNEPAQVDPVQVEPATGGLFFQGDIVVESTGVQSEVVRRVGLKSLLVFTPRVGTRRVLISRVRPLRPSEAISKP